MNDASPWHLMVHLASDGFWFPGLEVLLLLFTIFAAIMEWRRRRSGTVVSSVTPARTTMAIFYGLYGAITVILVAIATNVDLAKNHRTFFVLLNVVLTAYLCLWNVWLRNKLVGWVDKLMVEV